MYFPLSLEHDYYLHVDIPCQNLPIHYLRLLMVAMFGLYIALVDTIFISLVEFLHLDHFLYLL